MKKTCKFEEICQASIDGFNKEIKKERMKLNVALLLVLAVAVSAFNRIGNIKEPVKEIITGADQTHLYVPYLKGKRVAVMANPPPL
ncbi:hypothetical protein LWM68_25920 [Niabella sp. W65]|nr:hypothetical protein [Niabella sp. W65]MCH7365902.1 hypothetical protein [Niabella sp. W65]